MERRKLFSESRRKLFSESGVNIKKVVCQDCGYVMETAENVSSILCPKCGGVRFNVARNYYSPSGTPEPVKQEKTYSDRRNLFNSTEDFQKEFSDTTDELELKLKEFSGQTLSSSNFEKNFGDTTTAEDLVEKGFASIDEEGSVSISGDAFLQSRLFSKLVISVTKVLDLDPKITCEHNPAPFIDEIESNGGLCPKSIVILKKAHGILGPSECSTDSWAKDSGIMRDLKIEFCGQRKPLEEFKSTLSDRYPDAPDGLIDFLVKRGIIKSDGNQIEILK